MTDREKYYAYQLRDGIDFFSFINYFYFLGGSYAGPQVEYKVVDDFLNYRGDVTKVPNFGTFRLAFRRLLESFGCLILMVVTGMKCKQDYLFDPAFADETILFKVFYIIGCIYITIWRLFFAFGMIEANLIANGISYRAKTEKAPDEYNSIRHVKMWKFVSGLTAVDCISNWNMCT